MCTLSQRQLRFDDTKETEGNVYTHTHIVVHGRHLSKKGVLLTAAVMLRFIRPISRPFHANEVYAYVVHSTWLVLFVCVCVCVSRSIMRRTPLTKHFSHMTYMMRSQNQKNNNIAKKHCRRSFTHYTTLHTSHSG